ncbi:trace amine-associated receptor 7e-like [Astyanax mexicanus]|uniref:trace amine-associated receptor 7e-like n=1 Tax=Astyanax mexicanus TaxID=7994 RepID=UPI0020CB5839|nr:trace amine-associated receptor 7e-like [Astyanax mexicanus]
MSSSNSSARFIPLSVDFTLPEHYLIYAFHITFATCASVLAGSVLVGILKDRNLHAQNRFVFMINTSICDTLTGLSVFYLGLFDVQEGYPSRNGTFQILPSLLGVNIITFMFAQFDRYCAVCHPFFYNRYISRSVVIGVCVYSWFHVYVQPLASNLVPLAQAAQIYAFSIACLQIIVVTKVVMTVKLYLVAESQLKRDPPGAERDGKKESLRIIIVVVILFLTLWMPSFVNIILRQVSRSGLVFRNEATNAFAIMARLNAVSTPAVYLRGSPALRAAVWRAGWSKVLPEWTR